MNRWLSRYLRVFLFIFAFSMSALPLQAQEWITSEGNKVDAEGVGKSVHAAFATQQKASKSTPLPWGVQRVGASAIWDKTKGNARICVVGSGIDPAETSVRIDGGDNAIAPSNGFADDVGQGTAVAGIIASVAPEARIYAVKVMTAQDTPSTISPGALVKGIISCIHQGSRLINVVSIDQDQDQILERAVKYATARGAIIIAPAGSGLGSHNCGLAYPARYEKVIAVSGSTAGDELLAEGCGRGKPYDKGGYGFFENSGQPISFIAPGDRIMTKQLGGLSTQITGSNAAAAIVTGLAALYISLHPDATPDQILQALNNAATPLNGLTVDQQGRGMIDASKFAAP